MERHRYSSLKIALGTKLPKISSTLVDERSRRITKRWCPKKPVNHFTTIFRLSSYIEEQPRNPLKCLFFRGISAVLTALSKDTFDVKALRAFRVLRPLRLVSGVPSK